MMQRAGEWQSRSSNKTSPSSSTVRYLRSKISNQNRKSSFDSEGERSNFCCSIRNSNYSVDRGYINTIGENQIQLYYTKFTPNVKIGQVCIIHSFCQSSDDYLNMAEYFAQRGYIVNMVDLRGFGYSGGSRVNEPAKKILTDIQALLRNFQKDLKTFIIAHGLGALFINALLQQNSNLKISGVINISPLLRYNNNKESTLIRRLLLKISPVIFGNVLIHNMSNVTALSKDPFAIKQKIQSISFSQSSFTLKMADEYDRISKKVRDQAYKFVYPVLIVCGSKDFIQNIDEIKKYYGSISSQQKQFKLIQGGYHQLHNDYEGDELMMKIYNWMQSKKDVIKWKSPQPFAKDGVLKRSRLKFWVKISLIIGFILALIGLVRKLKLHKSLGKIIKN